MNTKELKEILDREGFNPLVYSLEGGDPDGALCIADERSRWCVYFSERGNRFTEHCYPTEDEACEALLERLRSLPAFQTKFKSQ